MKRVLYFFILLLLITACNAPITTEQLPLQNTTEVGATPEAVSTSESSTDLQTFAEPSTSFVEINAPIVDSPSIININMLDTINGWGISNTEILRTNDGGVTWYNVTPQGITETGYSLGAQFLDVTHAWLQFADLNNYPNGGTMYRTSDGGITWTSHTTPFSSGDISFLDSNNGWLLADLGVGAGSESVAVFQTTDGGATWNQTFTNDPTNANANDTLPRAGLKSGITPINMQTAWVNGVVYASGSIYLFRTDDSGKSWVNVQLPLTEEAKTAELFFEKVKFVSPTQGFLIMRITGPKIRTVIYQTIDAGNTWLPTTATLAGAGKLDILSAKEIVFYGTDQFYVTNDAAATFNIISPDIIFGESLIAIDFATASIGWAITTSPSGDDYTLYRTEDGGATWFAIVQ